MIFIRFVSFFWLNPLILFSGKRCSHVNFFHWATALQILLKNKKKKITSQNQNNIAAIFDILTVMFNILHIENQKLFF